jgi:hypothetical protein
MTASGREPVHVNGSFTASQLNVSFVATKFARRWAPRDLELTLGQPDLSAQSGHSPDPSEACLKRLAMPAEVTNLVAFLAHEWLAVINVAAVRTEGGTVQSIT